MIFHLLTLSSITTSIKQYNNIIIHQEFINLHHTSFIIHPIQAQNSNPLTPDIKHHEPNYKVRTPPLPWIEGRSTISGLNLRSCRFPLFPAACTFSSQSLFFYFFLSIISNNNKITLLFFIPYWDQINTLPYYFYSFKNKPTSNNIIILILFLHLINKSN